MCSAGNDGGSKNLVRLRNESEVVESVLACISAGTAQPADHNNHESRGRSHQSVAVSMRLEAASRGCSNRGN